MMRTRLGLGTLGFMVGCYGAYLLLSRQDAEQLRSAAIWLIAGVLLHDGPFALLALLVFFGVRQLPATLASPVTVGLVVFGTVTLAAVPVLLGPGGQPGETGLQGRPYGVWWVGFAVVVALVVLAAGVVRSRREGRSGDGESAGRRRRHDRS